MYVIGLTGPQGVGKTITAKLMKQILEDEYDAKAVVYSFADSLREVTADIIGERYVELSRDRDEKNECISEPLFVELLGCYVVPNATTPRDVLVKLGRAMRSRIGRDVFGWALRNRIDTSEDVNYVIIDDLRYENEVNLLRDSYKDLLVLGLERDDVAPSIEDNGTRDYLSFPLVDCVEVLAGCAEPMSNRQNYETINSILRTYI